jgi:endonuclease YncB( thermonuclease family)
MSNVPENTDYPALRADVTEVLQSGKERACLAVEYEKTNTYHTVGRLIHQHVLLNKSRAGYGDQVITKLAGDVGLSRSLVYQILSFYRKFPKVQSIGKLGWTHYGLLLGLPNDAQRAFYAEETTRKQLSTRALRSEIRSESYAKKEGLETTGVDAIEDPEGPLEPRRGRLNTYRVIGAEPGSAPTLWLDLGFGIQREIPCEEPESYPPNSILEINQGERQGLHFSTNSQLATRNSIFTYVARVERVIDGDTLWVVIDCGLQNRTRQKVRLRGIDTPELPTEDGIRAKEFVQDVVERSPFVVLATSKSDKYGRYLADLFYLPRDASPETVAEKGFFLNRKLVLEGLADRYKK